MLSLPHPPRHRHDHPPGFDTNVLFGASLSLCRPAKQQRFILQFGFVVFLHLRCKVPFYFLFFRMQYFPAADPIGSEGQNGSSSDDFIDFETRVSQVRAMFGDVSFSESRPAIGMQAQHEACCSTAFNGSLRRALDQVAALVELRNDIASVRDAMQQCADECAVLSTVCDLFARE